MTPVCLWLASISGMIPSAIIGIVLRNLYALRPKKSCGGVLIKLRLDKLHKAAKAQKWGGVRVRMHMPCTVLIRQMPDNSQ